MIKLFGASDGFEKCSNPVPKDNKHKEHLGNAFEQLEQHVDLALEAAMVVVMVCPVNCGFLALEPKIID